MVSCHHHQPLRVVSVHLTRPARTIRGTFVVAATLAYVVVRCGIGSYPSLPVELDISRALPDVLDLPAHRQYLHYSPAGPVLARLAGLDTPFAFQVLHAVVFVLAASVVIMIVARRYSGAVASIVVVAFVTSQTVLVLFAWVGSYDVFTWLVGTAIVLTRTSRQSAVAGFLAAFGTFEQTAISVVLLAALTATRKPVRENQYLPAFGGLLLGRLVLTVALRLNGVEHDRSYWLFHYGPSKFVDQFTDALPLFLLTAFGGAWVVLIACVLKLERRWERTAWISAMVLAVVPSALGEDQTRVYANITWPLLFALILLAGPMFSRAEIARTNGLALVAGIAIPPIFLWAGEAYVADHHLIHALN
jgi:hypothetical protein